MRNSTSTQSKDRIAAYEERVSGVSRFDRDVTIPMLALRSYHLPGNSWCDDYLQYYANNHPIFGICCHHALHPIRFRDRLVNLFGSIVFGLAVTNLIWLFFIFNEDRDEDKTVLTISLGGISTNVTATMEDEADVFEVTEGMLLLWTLGGGLHALYDNTVWYLTACVCCLPGQRLECLYRYKWCGTYFVVITVVACTAVASFVVVLRATLENDEDSDLSEIESGGLVDDKIDLGDVDDKSAWRFLVSYSIELALALFLYYPVVATVLFSGFLGCGKVPVLGGRPYEVALEERIAARGKRRSTATAPSEVSWETTDHTRASFP